MIRRKLKSLPNNLQTEFCGRNIHILIRVHDFFLGIRTHYAITVITIIACGLFSRTISAVPLFVGDMLYAMMMVAIIRCVFVSRSLNKVCFWSLMLCFAIEYSSLISYEWLMQLRSTRMGALVLG